MSTEPARHAAGSGKGGQFAATDRGEAADVSLAGAASTPAARLDDLARSRAAAAYADRKKASNRVDPEAQGAAEAHLDAAAAAFTYLADGRGDADDEREQVALLLASHDPHLWFKDPPRTLTATQAQAARDHFYVEALNAATTCTSNAYRYRDKEIPPFDHGGSNVLSDRGYDHASVEANAYWAVAFDTGGEPDPAWVDLIIEDARDRASGRLLRVVEHGQDMTNDWAEAVGETDYWTSPIEDRYPR